MGKRGHIYHHIGLETSVWLHSRAGAARAQHYGIRGAAAASASAADNKVAQSQSLHVT